MVFVIVTKLSNVLHTNHVLKDMESKEILRIADAEGRGYDPFRVDIDLTSDLNGRST